MLIALTGPPCSGKATIAHYLTTFHGFQPLLLAATAHHAPKFTSQLRQPLTFPTAEALTAHVTQHWNRDFVLVAIGDVRDWEVISKRPFAMLVGVDAPMSVRYRRVCEKIKNRTHKEEEEDGYPSEMTLAEFVEADEKILFGSGYGSDLPSISAMTLENSTPTSPPTSSAASTSSTDPPPTLHTLLPHATLLLFNPYPTLPLLHEHLRLTHLTNPQRLRPGWDMYFMALCDLAARRSNCMKRRVGCILVKNNRIIATGYNGTPRGVTNCAEGGCPRCNKSGAGCGVGLDVCLCLHAEENALLEAGRERIDDGRTILYCNTCPCLGCAKKIIQVGVKEVVYAQAYGMDGMTERLLTEAGVVLRQWVGVGGGGV
ncbi:deoxycytidylate deaminase-like protein [Fimicolochytrium jonesii]|uniref:deoxycytidylate deaminase-like protein n=1 Tax=Fimicolochytrium jonesii TaxID=1396493 RepID=UPI0022FE8F1F|nr:deoxycytidylate deaminase-like protein [Fimicolochytrium jonesii]KAI8816977.1 deoxycytidylate deaminase-like protein [Fimicolochytrium jonesii]